MSRLPSTYDVPGEYVFHTTTPTHLASIRDHGIHPAGGKSDGAVETIEKVIESLDVDVTLPFDRRAVSYHHISYEYMEQMYGTPPRDLPISPNPPVIIVTRFDQIDAPAFVGNMGLASDLLDYHYAGEDQLMHSASPEDALQQYRDTLVEVHTVDDLKPYSLEDDGQYELLVDGVIEPSAFATIID
jgi:hypothetical protein